MPPITTVVMMWGMILLIAGLLPIPAGQVAGKIIPIPVQPGFAAHIILTLPPLRVIVVQTVI